MQSVSVAEAREREEVLRFVESLGVVENAWLAWVAGNALGWGPDWYRVLLVRRDGCIVSAAGLALGWHGSRDAGYLAYLASADGDALLAILDALPRADHATLVTFDRVQQDTLSGCAEYSRSDGDIHFAVVPDEFHHIDGEDVVQLAAGDAWRFEGCEARPDWEHLGDARVFAILRDGRVAASLQTAPLTPAMPSGRGAASIGGVMTEAAYRRLGLGRRLVSYATALILREGNSPVYWTEPDNTASQRLCTGLGYRPYGRRVDFYSSAKRR